MSRDFRSGLGAFAALLLLGAAPDSFTLDELKALEAEKAAAEAKLEQLENAAETTERDLAVLESQLISAAMESRRREEQAAAAERRLIDLSMRLNAAQGALLSDRTQLEDLLGIMAAGGLRQPPALVVSPHRANEAVRRAIVTGDAAPRLAARADRLSQEVARLNALEREIRHERASLDAAEAVLALKEAEIRTLAAQKRAAFESASENADALRKRVATLSRKATTLRTLLAELEAAAPPAPAVKPRSLPRAQYASLSPGPGGTLSDAAPAGRPFSELQPLGAASLGRLARPAAGLIKHGYGDMLETGSKSEGLTIRTRGGAQVMAPADGRIEYADTFRTYGEMLILRTTDGYHVILSGLGRIYGTPGQTVSAGEPVGQMPGRREPPPELYLELRKDGTPMNPAKWMKRGR